MGLYGPGVFQYEKVGIIVATPKPLKEKNGEKGEKIGRKVEFFNWWIDEENWKVNDPQKLLTPKNLPKK